MDACVLAVSGTPGVGKTLLCTTLQSRGWSIVSLADVAEEHGCLGEVDTTDGAAPIDIHRLAEEWKPPASGRWLVDGHLAHLLEVDGLVLLRCRPSSLAQRLEGRGYNADKVRANVEWEMTAGHWAELIEFEIDLPLLELDAGRLSPTALADKVEAWFGEGLASDSLPVMADGAVDWLSESLD